MTNFDVIVIGSGSGGAGAAYTLHDKGQTVAVIDDQPFGGTCANRGCDPKKVLVGAAESVDWLERYKQKDILKGGQILDWTKLAEFKHGFVKDVPEDSEQGFKKSGIETFHGVATFKSPDTISINGQELKAKFFVIASGAKPAPLEIEGEDLINISDDFLNLKSLPKRIVFIGGGYISFEFAHIARRAGAEVTILHRSQNVLSNFDQDLVKLLVEASKELGLNIITNEPVVKVTKAGNSLDVHSSNGNKYPADLVIHGSGRVPNIDELDLEKAGVEFGKKGIKVNNFLQSVSNPQVYAAGDCADYGLPLTPMAAKEGQLVTKNILDGNKFKADFKAVPSVVFTIPPLATVGLSEQEAREKGLDFEVKFGETGGWFSSKRINEKFSGYKTLIEKGSGKILGAHLLGHGSEELINIFNIAIVHGLTSQDLKDLVYSFPTRSSDIEYMV